MTLNDLAVNAGCLHNRELIARLQEERDALKAQKGGDDDYPA